MTSDAAQWAMRDYMIRRVHQVETFGDCVEDGEPYPCRTIRILDHDFTSTHIHTEETPV